MGFMGLVLLYLILISTLGWFFGALGNLWSLGLFLAGGVIGWLIFQFIRPYLGLKWPERVFVMVVSSLFVFSSSESILGRGLVLVLLGLELVKDFRKFGVFRVLIWGYWLGLNYLLISKLMVRAGF